MATTEAKSLIDFARHRLGAGEEYCQRRNRAGFVVKPLHAQARRLRNDRSQVIAFGLHRFQSLGRPKACAIPGLFSRGHYFREIHFFEQFLVFRVVAQRVPAVVNQGVDADAILALPVASLEPNEGLI